ncbi:hypothetical protein LTS10_003120 [Elasticomyces elasticus]|nr:hypothetical protein LTS10_003120 [Elasticomyces elasticus]
MEAAIRWSPFSTPDRRRFLVVDASDSSLTLNEIDHIGHHDVRYHRVSRYAKLPAFAAFACSPLQESIVALGHVSGNASLIRLGEDKQSSEIVATFAVKQRRKCNAVDIGRQNWLAVALDKTRSDVCLNVYDINKDAGDSAEPIRRLCAAEIVSSVCFFLESSQELVATTQRSFVRIYDLRDGHAGSGNLQAASRHVNNIRMSPDGTHFATAGPPSDPSFTIWDKRWLGQGTAASSNSAAVMSITFAGDGAQPLTIRDLRWSGSKPGRLAVSTSTGEIQMVDIKTASHSPSFGAEYVPSNPYGGTTWESNCYVTQTRTLRSPESSEEGRSADCNRVVGFDWIEGLEAGEDDLQKVIILERDHEVSVINVPGFKAQARGTAQDNKVWMSDGSPSNAIGNDLSVPDAAPVAPHVGADDVMKVNMTTSIPLQTLSDSSPPSPRERCQQGYLFDCRKNADIISGNWHLERLWEIVNRLRAHAAENGMVYGSLDLSYIGIAGIWAEQIGNVHWRTLSRAQTSMPDAIIGLASSKEFPPFTGQRTDYPEHRQLCLAACGWRFTTETLEEECQQLVERGLHYQAIVQAVLHDYKHVALNLLRTLIRSRTIPNIGLGALLAADMLNDDQREMCKWMAADTDEPALKALLAYLTTGDWRDVMKTTYLHLGYRVALGLKYLNDTELSGFLQAETARAVRNGDLEGILLTGLSEQAIDLLQTYIARTSDLQTAVLATAHTNPRYVDDVRWVMWKETYFEQMQAWRAFNERTKFTVQHARMANTTIIISSSEQPEKPRVQLSCNHCHASPSQGRNRSTSRSHAGQNTPTNKITGPSAHSGTVCLTCGRHMPRCAICKLWLGTPTVANISEADGSLVARMIAMCLQCGHGYHGDHAQSWFRRSGGLCAVPGCECMCELH